MNNKDLFDAIGNIDDEFIERSEETKKRKNINRIALPAAAGFCLIIVAAVFAAHSINIGKVKSTSAVETTVTAYQSEEGTLSESMQEETTVQEETTTEVNAETNETTTAVSGGEDSKKAAETSGTTEWYYDGIVTGDTAASSTSAKPETTGKTEDGVTEAHTPNNYTEPVEWHIFNAIVTEVKGDCIVVEKYEHQEGAAYKSTDVLYPTGELYQMNYAGKIYNLNVGDKITVYYTGEVMSGSPKVIETYKINSSNFVTE